ncbi:MAG: hypothetical protein ACFFAO_19970 [Candidatus Hermodarchaeota archaeon]
MKNLHNNSINIELKDLKSLKYFKWDLLKNKLTFSISFKELNQMKLIDDSILHIQFDNGDFLIDLPELDLEKLKIKLKGEKNGN